MPEQVREVAARVRAMREICELTAKEVADKLDMALDEYLACENGEVDIPISFLTGVAPIFGIEVTSLMSGKTPKLQGYCLVRKGRGVAVQRMNRDYAYESLAFNFRQKQVEPFHVTIQPDDPDAEIDLNSHNGQEFDYILEGIMQLNIGGKELIMTEGDSIYFDSNIPHGMKAISGPVRFMALVIPPREVY